MIRYIRHAPSRRFSSGTADQPERRTNREGRDGPPACSEHANGPDHTQLNEPTGVAVADHATARHTREAAAMNDDVKAAIDEIANSLQVMNLLSTRLRQNLGESSQHAVDLEGAAARAVRAMKRLQPQDKKKR